MGGDEPEPEPGTIVEFVVDDITPKTPSTVHWNKAWFVNQTNICSLNIIENATIDEAFEKTVFLVTMLMYLDYQFTVRYLKKKDWSPTNV